MNTCERCDAQKVALTMSWFNTEMICPSCSRKEKAHPKFKEAQQADIDSVKQGNNNFPGIGLPPELKR